MLYSNYHNRDIGRMGEDIACKYIESIGYKVLDRNYRTRYGEIDIIASYKKEEIVFIEVKTRLSVSKGNGAENVDSKKVRKIMMVAKKYILENRLFNNKLRFDVIEITFNNFMMMKKETGTKSLKGKINHIKNILL